MNFVTIIVFLIILVAAYFLGSIPFGVLIGKKFKDGIDIREHGSKNTGATNAYRVLGPKLGLIVLFCDIMKGFLPVIVARILSFESIGLFPAGLVAVIAIVSILGHTFSPFLDFKGGKGVATSLGAFLAIVPIVMILDVLIFVIIVYISRYISLGSMIAAAAFPVLAYFIPVIMRSRVDYTVVAFGILVAVYIIYKHKTNINRLLKGEENKFKL